MREVLRILYRLRILKRIIPSLLKVVVNVFKWNEIVIKNKGLLFNINLKNPIDREIYLKGNYEKKQIEFLQKQIEKNKIKIFLDIGAHMGFYSLNMSKKKILIYSFEPAQKNFNQLKKNKDLNNKKNICVYNLALSNKKKNIEMWVPDENKTGGFSIFDRKDEEIKKYNKKKLFKIQGKSNLGDNLLKFNNKKIAIKIDVERHERKVLDGMKNILKKNKIILQIELFEERKKEIKNYLKRINFFHYHTIKKDCYFKNF